MRTSLRAVVVFIVMVCTGTDCSRQPETATPQQTRDHLIHLRNTSRDARLAVEQGGSAARIAAWRTSPSRATPQREAALLGIATVQRFQYQLPDAQQTFRQLRERGLATTQLYATLALGEIAAAQFDIGGLPIVRDAYSRAQALGDSSAMAEALWLRGRLELRLGSRDSAYAVYARAKTIVPASDVTLRASIACYTGMAERQRNPARADSLIDTGSALAALGPLRRVSGFCHLARAQTRHWVGENHEAASQTELSIRLLRLSRDQEVEASSWQLLAYLNSDYLGQLGRATAAADSAISTGTRSGNRLAVGWAHLVRAQVEMRLGETERAWVQADSAEQQLRVIGDRLGLATVTLVRAEAAHAEARLDVAETRYLELERQYVEDDRISYLPAVWLRLAALARKRNDIARADSLLQRVKVEVERSGLAGFGTDRLYELALVRAKSGDWTAADTLLARFAATVGELPIEQFAAASRRAEVAAGAGRFADALAHLRRAEALLLTRRAAMSDRVESLVAIRAQRIDFDADFGLPLLVERLATSGRILDALHAADVHGAHAALMRDERERAELATAPGNPQYGARSGERRTSDAVIPVSSRLPARTALLQFVIGDADEPSTLLVVQRGGATAVPLRMPLDLSDQITRFGIALAADAPALGLGRALANMLVSPALAGLEADIDRLLIVADGPLHRLPFEALVLPNGQRLLQAFDVAMLPSARMLGRPPVIRKSSRGARIIAFGDPVFASGRGLAPLPASRVEAEQIITIDPMAILMLGNDASELSLKSMSLRSARVLHFATHATVHDAGLLGSTLHLSAGRGEDGEMQVSDIARLNLTADLVVLSACRTAGGTILRGEGVQGISAPFFEAGARNVLATRWPVRDTELLPLMTAIYARLGQGASVAAAIHAARLQSIARGDGPRRWASLTLAGDGRAVPMPTDQR